MMTFMRSDVSIIDHVNAWESLSSKQNTPSEVERGIIENWLPSLERQLRSSEIMEPIYMKLRFCPNMRDTFKL